MWPFNKKEPPVRSRTLLESELDDIVLRYNELYEGPTQSIHMVFEEMRMVVGDPDANISVWPLETWTVLYIINTKDREIFYSYHDRIVIKEKK